MADNLEHPVNPDDESHDSDALVPIEDDESEIIEDQHPRREAHAEFVVQAEQGTASVLREAMDPANQSLADALRLSYRVLQLVMVVLVVLFLISGFRSVKDNETGVRTLYGQIKKELDPGLETSFWPYPAAEFIVLPRSGAVAIRDTFWPDAMIGNRSSYEDAAGDARPRQDVRLGLGARRDGFLLLEGEDLGHMQLQATFEIEPMEFVQRVRDEAQARELVRLALQRASVQVAAIHTLDNAVSQEDVIAEEIRAGAQAFLNDLGCGIILERVQVTNIRPPLAVYSAQTQLGEARNAADSAITTAQTERNRQLAEIAGENWEALLALVEEYEAAVMAAGDEGVEAAAVTAKLAEIEELLQGEQIGGQIAIMMQAAKSYREVVRADLGRFAQRFESLYPRYQENPELVIRNLWIDTYRTVLTQPATEIFYLPTVDGRVTLNTTSLYEAMLEQRKLRQERQSAEARAAAGITGPWSVRFGDEDRVHRLEIDEESGRVRGRRSN